MATQRPLPTSQGITVKNLVKFAADYYDEGAVKFAAGQYYPLNSETSSLVTSGHADLIDDDANDDAVGVLKARARVAQERAKAAAQNAETLADEAAAALELYYAAAPEAAARDERAAQAGALAAAAAAAAKSQAAA